MNISKVADANIEDLILAVDDLRKSCGDYNEEKIKLDVIIQELVDRSEYPATDKSGRYPAQKMVDMYGALWHMYRGPHNCPHCDADLRDHENGVPYKREIGIYTNDLTVAWQCPDCEHTWAR